MNIAVIINNKEELKRIDDYINKNYSDHLSTSFLSDKLPLTIALNEAEWSWAPHPESLSPSYEWYIFNSGPADKIITCDEFLTISSSNLLLII